MISKLLVMRGPLLESIVAGRVRLDLHRRSLPSSVRKLDHNLLVLRMCKFNNLRQGFYLAIFPQSVVLWRDATLCRYLQPRAIC